LVYFDGKNRITHTSKQIAVQAAWLIFDTLRREEV
jgi:hypothetical protein